MEALEAFKKIAKTPYNHTLSAHKDKGGKIVGIFCSYAPEEMVMAAGMIPFRMRAVGSDKTTLGDAWFSSLNCSFVRHTLDMALEGNYGFLDGVVFINACDHIRRMYDNWRRGVDGPGLVHMMSVPHKAGGRALAWYREELDLLRQKIESHFKLKITDDDLRAAIKVSNQTRRLLAKLYELRKDESPPITAAETLSVIMAGTAMERERFNELLDQLLEEIPGRKAYKAGAPRLLIMSGCLEEPEHLELIEGQGGAIVDDLLCHGRRYFDTLVDEENKDPIQALAERYMNHLSCPRIGDDFGRRIDRVKESTGEYGLDGVIVETLKFCNLWGGESFIMRQESRKTGMPTLHLERELYGGGDGQVKTRVQAFLERIGKF